MTDAELFALTRDVPPGPWDWSIGDGLVIESSDGEIGPGSLGDLVCAIPDLVDALARACAAEAALVERDKQLAAAEARTKKLAKVLYRYVMQRSEEWELDDLPESVAGRVRALLDEEDQ